MIQFSSATLLYTIGGNLTNYQFLFEDLFITIPLCLFMGETGPYKKLSKYLPAGALISLPVLSSVLGSIVIQFLG